MGHCARGDAAKDVPNLAGRLRPLRRPPSVRSMLTRRMAWVGLGFVLGCGAPTEEMMDADTEPAAMEGIDGEMCAEIFEEAQCVGGGLPRFVAGDVELPDDLSEPVVVEEFEGGRIVEGQVGDVEVIYADASCLVTCVWTLGQRNFCEGVNEDGEKTCAYGGPEPRILEECRDFTASCGG